MSCGEMAAVLSWNVLSSDDVRAWIIHYITPLFGCESSCQRTHENGGLAKLG